MADQHANFAYSTVATVPTPPRYGVSLIVNSGDWTLFPTPPFNATIWPAGEQPTSTNAEIVRVTNISTDTFTIIRGQENTNNRRITVGDQIAATITAQVMSDAEGTKQTWSPYVIASTGLQTINNATNNVGTGSLFVFPVTVAQDIRFNQIIIGNSLSNVTSSAAGTISNSYYSLFGLYSMNANTLSLISSNSFSIGETIQNVSASWYYPTSTATTGYGYGSFPGGQMTATAQFASYVTGTRAVGLQFGGNLKLSPDIYYVGVLSIRNTGNANNFGVSHAGIIGQPINPMNQAGTISGLYPIGFNASLWPTVNSNITGWWGRHVIGFLTNITRTDFGGSVIPTNVQLSELGATAAASIATILPTVTFVST